MDNPTLYERLGGAVGTAAVVRAGHDRVLSDPERADLAAEAATDAAVLADTALLARLLGGPCPPGVDTVGGGGLLLTDADVARPGRTECAWTDVVITSIVPAGSDRYRPGPCGNS